MNTVLSKASLPTMFSRMSFLGRENMSWNGDVGCGRQGRGIENHAKMFKKHATNGPTWAHNDPKWHPKSTKIEPWSSFGPPWVPRGRPEGTPGRPQGAPGRLRWLQGCILVPKEGPNADANQPKMGACKTLISERGLGRCWGAKRERPKMGAFWDQK